MTSPENEDHNQDNTIVNMNMNTRPTGVTVANFGSAEWKTVAPR